MPSAHALLSPSSAHRWLHCTPSAVLASKVEDKGSVYAEEGTCAHALCEMKLLQALDRPCEQAQREYEELAAKYATPEMQESADLYVSIILEKWAKAQAADHLARIYVERRLDFTSYVPESFGTADCIILSNACLEVIDFKYGKGVEVSADHNPQMMIYALGAYDEFFLDYQINEVCMTIVQPRISHIDSFTMPADELTQWAEKTLQPAAIAAFAGEGALFPGDHCRFCPVKATCTEIALQTLDLWRENKDAKTIPSDVFPYILRLVPMIEQWAASVKDHALALALEGNTPAGFKLVEGRSVRVISEPEALANALSALDGFPAESIYKPRELQTIGALEKLVGKKRFNEVAAPFISKPAGKPTLAPITDKRPPLDPSISAALDFAGL